MGFFREALNKSSSMKLQWEMSEFKAKIARHSTAMAQSFNAGIVYFTCSVADHDLIRASLESVENPYVTLPLFQNIISHHYSSTADISLRSNVSSGPSLRF